jgi:hypothetical protein
MTCLQIFTSDSKANLEDLVSLRSPFYFGISFLEGLLSIRTAFTRVCMNPRKLKIQRYEGAVCEVVENPREIMVERLARDIHFLA